jgi:dihydroorotate dehydrogenase
LSDLLSAICSKKSGKKIFLKLSPVNNLDDKKFIIDFAKKFHVDALVIANTVPDRNFDLKSDSPIIQQKGGLSGPPILERSIPLIRMGYKSGLPVIGVGGVSSGKDAYRLIRNGASLIQLYTAMVYHGPFVFEDIHRGLERCLLIDGFRNVSEIIGIDAD